MSLRTRILLGILLIVVSFGIGYGLYRLFFAPAAPSVRPVTPGQVTDTSNPDAFPIGGTADRTSVTGGSGGTVLPISATTNRNPDASRVPGAEATITLAFEGNANNVTLGDDGVQFYNESDGKFYTIDAAGNVIALSDQVFFRAETVTWDPNGAKAVIEYPDGANIIYDFDTEEQVTLPAHWESFSFSNDGSNIAAKSVAVAPENRWLLSTDSSGNNVTLIEPMGENGDKVLVDWSPNSQVVAFSRTGQSLGAERQEILMVGQNGENFPSIVVEGRDFRPEWSPAGDTLLYSVHSSRSDFRPELWIVNSSGDAIGSGRTFLNVNTWADKCTFDTAESRYVYCGVPESLERGAGFVPDISNGTADIIYRIDTVTGARSPISTAEDTYLVVDDIQVRSDEGVLYVTNRADNNIYKIDL